ncbi:iron ABC transporter permease [Aeromicrobium sp. Root495]|uniref:FecCD family ABC transporter permease n=1 Tax=Aeromicrobium sp. Root495 TaxID=1736550 RepID=UPI0006FDDE2F|nr:iron ABC transporter permease [Aeromicrobium sp. Root495]KQY55993.1 iron ABC transporter permease [Aeromicrobium sp. Root495]
MTTTTRPPTPSPAPARAGAVADVARITGLVVLTGVLVVVAFASITLGTRGVGVSTIIRSFTDYDPDSTAQTVIRELRVPRTIIGILAGMALGLGGALLQGVTRNPLADPSIMGTTNGASAAIVVTIMVFGAQSLHTYVWFGFLGAAAATFLVYAVASFGREGATPVKLALAGAAVSAGLYSLITGIVMTNLDALNEMRVWQVGSLASRGWPILHQVWPFFVVGILAALVTARWLNGLALGDDIATALGQRVARTRGLVFVIVTVLAGSAVAACGPIVFVGLVVPHLARAICGPDYRWTLPYTLLLSPILLLAADIVGRLVMRPGELQVGVVLGVIGAPAFILLVRRRNLAEL